MKNAVKMSDWQEKNKPKPKEERWVTIKPCIICGTTKEGYYSRHGDGGTCSRVCMVEQDKKPLYPEHPEKE